MYKLVLSCFFFVILFPSCNSQPEKTVGGPCTYETKIFPATLTVIKRKDWFTADLIFRITDNNGALYRDSVSWYIENKAWVNVPDILEKEIIVGNNYKYIVEEIKTGTCTPKIEKLTLEKYK